MPDTPKQVTHVRLLLEGEQQLPALKITPTFTPEEAVAEAIQKTADFYVLGDPQASVVTQDAHGPDTQWRVLTVAACFCKYHPDFISLFA